MHDYTQHRWQSLKQAEIAQLLNIALTEDLQTAGDITCQALASKRPIGTTQGSATIHARSAGTLAGTPLIPKILALVDADLVWTGNLNDAVDVDAGDVIGNIHGPALGLLMAERTVLNFLGRLSGIATLTKRYVDAVQGTKANIYDTRKTTPGWRQLEKYAVVCGGGRNHRTGLFDAILIKDNHLALGRQEYGGIYFTPAQAVVLAKEFLRNRRCKDNSGGSESVGVSFIPFVTIEVDTLEQLEEVLPAGPDIVLLDNMSASQMIRAVQIRDAVKPAVQLEASGGITLESVRRIAETGIERISVGALTHSAVSLDFGLDWG